MGQYVVRQGDCFASIAATWGLSVDELAALGDNERHRAEGRSGYTLRPGDVIEIPDEEPNRSTKFQSGNEKRRVRVPIPDVHVRVRLKDRQGHPYVHKRYELEVSGRTLTESTDENGLLDQLVPARATEAMLKLYVDESKPPLEIPLAIGSLQAITTDTGVSQRLHCLGYGTAQGAEARKYALYRFQRAEEGLTANGHIDQQTRDRLESRRLRG